MLVSFPGSHCRANTSRMGVGPGNEINPSRMSIQAEWEWGLGMRLTLVECQYKQNGSGAWE